MAVFIATSLEKVHALIRHVDDNRYEVHVIGSLNDAKAKYETWVRESEETLIAGGDIDHVEVRELRFVPVQIELPKPKIPDAADKVIDVLLD